MHYASDHNGGHTPANYTNRPITKSPPRKRSRLPFKRTANIAQATGPFTPLKDQANVVVVADVENLAYGARDLGMTVNFGLLGKRLGATLNKPALHAVFSAPASDGRTAQLLTAMGWSAHQRNIVGRQANADSAIAFQAAALIASMNAKACIIATGDGGLALDIANGIRSSFRDCSLIATMSLAGSTSHLLDARRTPVIDLNIEIGRDVMRSNRQKRHVPIIPALPSGQEGHHHA